MMQLTAISFDFWGTLFFGHQDIYDFRACMLHEFMSKFDFVIDLTVIRVALTNAVQTAHARWHTLQQHTSCAQMVELVFAECKFSSKNTYSDEALYALICDLEEVNLSHFSPVAYSETIEVIQELARRYPLGLISDVGMTPGRVLREILRRSGIADCFKVWTFSDEIGRTKPDPLMFTSTAQQLGVQINEMLHVGDDLIKDYHGGIHAGAHALLVQRNKLEDITDPLRSQTINSLTELLLIL